MFAALLAVPALLVAAAGEGAQAAAPDPARIVGEDVGLRPALVRDYWTPARMRAAVPADLSLAARGRPAAAGVESRGRPSSIPPARASDVSFDSATNPRRLHGKVFFSLGSGNFVCSGTLVTSNSRSLVWTAGHCVHGADIGAGFATNWAFVPGYRDGIAPYGTWPARTLFSSPGWIAEANVRYDLGAAVLTRDPQGKGLEDLLGARGISFNQPRTQTFDILGYPAEDANTMLLPPNFDGERLWLCESPRTADDTPAGPGPETMEVACDMTGGSSGGGWVIGDQFVNSVTSYGYEFDFGHLYGPYQGTVAEQLYETASGPRRLCAGLAATNVGTGLPNAFTGTEGNDVFRLVGGDDGAAGGAGNDAACGGGGADSLLGAEGADRLRGGGGDDILRGGPGRDECFGGPGDDRAFGCEIRRGLP